MDKCEFRLGKVVRCLFAIILLLAGGCSARTNRQIDPIAVKESVDLHDTLTYTYQNTLETSSYYVKNSNVLDTSYYSISYPLFANNDYNNLLQSGILLNGENSAQEAATAFIEGYNEFVEDVSTTSIHATWFRNSKTIVELNTPRFLTIKTHMYEYTGGAHGNAAIVWSNYDILNKRKIDLSSLILEGKLFELTQIAESKFRKQENLADTSSLSKDFFFEHGIFALNDNFGLTKNELVFYYNEYEIKPYSEGGTSIQIPFSEIEGLLSEQGKRYIQSIK